MVSERGTGARGATETRKVRVNATEMARQLVLFGIANRAHGMMRLKSDLAQRRSRESQAGGGEHPPIRVAPVVGGRRTVEHEPRPVEASEAIRELVLQRLELADELTELAAHLGVLQPEFESALRRAESARRADNAGDQRKLLERCRRTFDPCCGRPGKGQFAQRRHGKAARGRDGKPRRIG